MLNLFKTKVILTFLLSVFLLLTSGCNWLDQNASEPAFEINGFIFLSVSEGSLSPAFDLRTTQYTVDVENNIESIQVTATIENIVASLKINNVITPSGTASSPINLIVGSNTIEVVVTARNGETRTITITVNRAQPVVLSNNADLSNLTLSSGDLTPVFSTAIVSYSASVSSIIDNITVTPTTADANAVILVDGVTVSSNTASAPITLNAGDNTISIVVTAEDGITTLTYTLVVNRAASNKFFFPGNDGTTGWELWKSDGSTQGTVLVKDINPDGNSYPSGFTVMGNMSYFSVYDDSGNGGSLWKSDGTENGTVLVKDFNPGGISHHVDFISMDNILYFVADDGATGRELWKSDGTAAGTALVKDIYPDAGVGSSISSLYKYNGELFFAANDGNTGIEIWKSDGTATGTVLVKDIFPFEGSMERNSSPRFFEEVNGVLYFSAADSCKKSPFTDACDFAHFELWRTDGTTVNTTRVKKFWFSNANGSANPTNLINYKGSLYFSVNDDNIHGISLWKSDGTDAGTVLVNDINPNSSLSATIDNFTILNNVLMFRGYGGSDEGFELWKSDGTDAGTSMVKDIAPSPGSSSPRNLVAVSNSLFFTANDSINGSELWKSDGTDLGTVMIKDINQNGSSNIYQIYGNVDGVLYFGADDGIAGMELWKSDGTAAGTMMIKDINPAGDGVPNND